MRHRSLNATSINVTIFSDPVSWSRPRRHGNRVFMDPKMENAKKKIAMHLRGFFKGEPDKGRWRVSAIFNCETKRRRDLDRLLSLVFDAAEGIIYENDSQIDELGEVKKVLGFKKGEGKSMLSFERIE